MNEPVLTIGKYRLNDLPTRNGHIVLGHDEYRFVPIEIGCYKNVIDSVKELLFPEGKVRPYFEYEYFDDSFVFEVPVDSFVENLRSNEGPGNDAVIALEKLPSVGNPMIFPTSESMLQLECYPANSGDRETLDYYLKKYFV